MNNLQIIKSKENNNELIKIQINENQEPIVSGRELHKSLEVKTEYRHWFPRMVEYGFIENIDYTPFFFEHPQNKQQIIDHALKLDMAKEIAMIQRNGKGKLIRKYFIEVEKEYNSPEKVMARALVIANKEIASLKFTNEEQEKQIIEMKPKATYYDMILQCNSLLTITEIAKDYGYSAMKFNELLHNFKIQYKKGKRWFLYSEYQNEGYTASKTNYIEKNDIAITQMYWTQKGRVFLYNFLKENGILPLIEKEEF